MLEHISVYTKTKSCLETDEPGGADLLAAPLPSSPHHSVIRAAMGSMCECQSAHMCTRFLRSQPCQDWGFK